MWIENARRVMPKGQLLPVPLLCTLTVGAPIKLAPDEPKRRVRRAHARRAARADAARRMTPQQQTYSLFVGVGLVLVVASLVGYVLKQSVAKGQPHATIDNLNARIKAWWVMVLVISLAFLFGKTGVILLFLFISFAALREFMTLTYTRSADYLALAAAFFVVLPVQYAAHLRRLVRPVLDLHSGLRVPAAADPRGRRRRHQALPRAHRRRCSGAS